MVRCLLEHRWDGFLDPSSYRGQRERPGLMPWPNSSPAPTIGSRANGTYSSSTQLAPPRCKLVSMAPICLRILPEIDTSNG